MVRPRIVATLAATVALAAGVSAAYAALTLHSTRYKGTGPDYFNKHGHWQKVRAAPRAFHFSTSSDGKTLIGFRGDFATYCGGGNGYVSAKKLFVSRSGAFAYQFSLPAKRHGTVYGHSYYEIYGHFTDKGHKASVNYLFDYVLRGEHVRSPYDTSTPGKLGCASWVRGTATAASTAAKS